VKNAVFTKGRGLSITDMVEDAGLFEILRNFRAGIEAGISFLKRCFGLRRCLTSGLESFKAWGEHSRIGGLVACQAAALRRALPRTRSTSSCHRPAFR